MNRICNSVLISIIILFHSVAVYAQVDCSVTQGNKVVIGGAEVNLQFGTCMDMQGDTAVAGARGRAFVMERGNYNGLWAVVQELMPDGGLLSDFGCAAALDGEWIIVGASYDNSIGCAVMFHYEVNSDSWVYHSTIHPSGSGRDDQVGFSVAVHKDVAVVGAPEIIPLDGLGYAWVYRFDGSVWNEEQKLTASDSDIKDHFGNAVAVYNDVITVGARNENNTGSSIWDGTGAVYVYRYDADGGGGGGVWTEEVKLTSPAPLFDEYDKFGYALAMQDETLLVGTNPISFGHNPEGSAYVFRYSGSASGWVTESKFTAADGVGAERFGSAVALDGGLALIGAWGDPSTGESCPFPQICDSGSAYLFARDGVSWSEVAMFTSDDIEQKDTFGWGLGISGESALVGARMDDDEGRDTGSVYGFDFGSGGGGGGNGSCVAPTLDVEFTACPAGGPGRISWRAATAQGKVAVVFSPVGVGEFTIPNNMPCAGVQLDLSGVGIRLGAMAKSDINGGGVLNTIIPERACGGHLQLLDLGNCRISNVVVIR